MSQEIGQKLLYSPRALVTYRVVIALLGGYAVSAALTLLITHFSTYEGRDLRVLIYVVFFLLYTAAIIYLFAINSHRKAFLITLGANVVAWGALWGMGGLS